MERLTLALIAMAATASARVCLETDAYITPKTENRSDQQFAGNVLLNLAALDEGDEHDVENKAVSEEAAPGEIITTKDIDNYFNLQITTKMYVGSE